MRLAILKMTPLILIVCGLGLAALTRSPELAGPHAAATQIDFDALHREAHDALEQLRLSGERRLALSSAPRM
jgi:hypothetical protein